MKLNEISIAVKIQLKVDSSINENPWDFSYLATQRERNQTVFNARRYGRSATSFVSFIEALPHVKGMELQPYQKELLQVLFERQQKVVNSLGLNVSRLGKSIYQPATVRGLVSTTHSVIVDDMGVSHDCI